MSEPKTVGRPKGAKVTKMRGYRLTEEDIANIDWLAAHWNRTHVDALREAVRQACSREGKPK